jgi:hypothetical protein
VADLTGNPLFPYFNEYWRSPLALAAPYRDLRFRADAFLARAAFFPVLFTIDWHVADDLGFQDIRVALAYLVIAAGHRVGCGRAKPRPAGGQARHAACSPSRASYFVWLRMFAIYRYIILLEMLAPAPDRGAVGCLPLPRRPLSGAGRAHASPPAAGDGRSDFLERAPVEDPLCPGRAAAHSRIPDHTMVLMTGDAPMGFIATVPAAPDPRAADRRLDGAAPRRHPAHPDMMRRVADHLARRRRSLPDRRCRRHGPRP